MDEQLEFVKQIASRLASAEINYMMTGSMAMAVYATPRMTRDIDVVIESGPEHVDTIVRLFETDCYVSRDAVREAMAQKGIQTSVHYPAVHRFSTYEAERKPLPNTEFAADHLITMPLFGAMTPEQVDAAVAALKEALRKS